MTALLLGLSLTAAACGSDETTSSATTAVAEATTDASSGDTESTDASSGDTASSDATSSGSTNTAEVVAAADALIATLSDDEVDTLLYDFGDSAITSEWSNLPACENGNNTVARAGIQHADLSDDQATAVLNLAAAVLSDAGYTEYLEVIAADDYLQDTYGNTVWDPGCYFMAIYGTPSETDAFAVQFGGHHYARMVTYEGDVATVTPAFLGIEPGSYEVDGTTVATMEDEMTSVYGLFADLSDDQLTTAELDATFTDVLLGPGEDEAFPETEGLAVSELTEDQQSAVLTAIRTFVDDYDEGTADSIFAEIESELSETFIAWSVATDLETENAYARIDGPSVWIEVGNQSGLSGIHFHSIYRDKTNDYGEAG